MISDLKVKKEAFRYTKENVLKLKEKNSNRTILLKTPQFGKTIFYEWQKPDFNPELDPFMKNFDENGNFTSPPKPEEVIKEYFNSSMKVVYEFLGGKK